MSGCFFSSILYNVQKNNKRWITIDIKEYCIIEQNDAFLMKSISNENDRKPTAIEIGIIKMDAQKVANGYHSSNTSYGLTGVAPSNLVGYAISVQKFW